MFHSHPKLRSIPPITSTGRSSNRRFSSIDPIRLRTRGVGVGGWGGNIRSYSNSTGSWKPKKSLKGKIETHTLEKLLEEGKNRYKKVMEMLKAASFTEAIYRELLDKESKLKIEIDQILRQIANKRKQ